MFWRKEPCADLRIPDTYELKIAEICNFWTFKSVIQLTNHLFEI